MYCVRATHCTQKHCFFPPHALVSFKIFGYLFQSSVKKNSKIHLSVYFDTVNEQKLGFGAYKGKQLAQIEC